MCDGAFWGNPKGVSMKTGLVQKLKPWSIFQRRIPFVGVPADGIRGGRL